MTEQSMTKSQIIRAILIIFLGALFYLFEFALQVSPSVMTQELMRDFDITAAGVGAISAFYYYSYTPFQLAAGLLYDKFGPRLLMSFACVVCAIGALIFSNGDNVFTLSWARFMMGSGSAFAFIGCLILIANWFPARHFALVVGIVQAMSSVGAICGQIPLSAAVHAYGWQNSLFIMSGIGFVLALLVALVVRNQPPWKITQPVKSTKGKEPFGLFRVLRQAQTWILGLFSFGIWSPMLVFASLWGIPFLVEKYNISTTDASAYTAMTWIGVAIGGPLLGWTSTHIQKRKPPLIVATILGLIGAVLVIYFNIPKFLVSICLLFIGIAAAAQSLAFAVVKETNLPQTLGTAIGINNMFVVAGGIIFQPLVGLFLHYYWTGGMLNEAPIYSVEAYEKSLFVLPLVLVMCLILSVYFIKETHGKPIYKK